MTRRSRTRTAAVAALTMAAACVLGSTGASAATPPPAPPDAPAGAATTSQMNSVHDGVAAESLSSPLYKSWSRDFGATVGYPLVVNGRVFVATNNPDGTYGTQLWALDADDGSTIWGPKEMSGTYYTAGIAADGANVYVMNYNGLLTAIDQATGNQVWSAKMTQTSFSSPLTVRHGVVYAVGSGMDGTLFAVSAATGGILWTAAVGGGLNSSPAVTDDGVYVSYACGVSYRFDPTTGHQEWVRTTDCVGGTGRTPVVNDGQVYVRAYSSSAVLDATTGAVDGTFSSSTTPTFDGEVGFYLQDQTLRAVDTATNQTLWSQAGDGGLVTAPVMLGSEVAIGSSTGRVFVLNAQTGVVDWSGSTGSPITGPEEWNAARLTGLSASGRQLFVPASNTLVAYNHLGPDQAFVMALYQDFLGRSTDHDGLAHWVGMLQDGTTTSTVASMIAFSNEASRAFVATAYLAILGRPADDAGLRYWSSAPGGALYANRIVDALYASAEYFRDAGGTDGGWVKRLYRDILGRPAQAGEASYWTNQTEHIGRGRVAAAIAGSQEAADRRIDALYQKMLGHPADDQGRTSLRPLVEQLGTPIAAVMIAGSPEYVTHALARME